MNTNIQGKLSEEINNQDDYLEDKSLQLEADFLSNEHDLCFSVFQQEIIKSLFKLAPISSSRETRKLIFNVDLKSIKEIYNSIFTLTKVSNKELLHYLGIIHEYPHPDIDLDLLVNLKLNAQDKYTTATIHMYFMLIDQVYEKLNQQQRLKIFYRYIYVFSSRICQEKSLFVLFSRILKHDFLELFIKRQFYLNFPFFKEFLIEFGSNLGNYLIKIGYEIPIYRRLIYYISRENDSNQGLTHLDWIMYRWQISNNFSIPKLFYFFDCSPFLDDLALVKFQGSDNLLDLIKNDIENSTDVVNHSILDPKQQDTAISKCSKEKCFICSSKGSKDGNISEKVECWKQAKIQMAQSIDKFNKTGILGPEIDITFIRLIPSVDLKVLGHYLCKEKNYDVFLKFTNSFDFRGMNILEALRYFLSSFILSGESQIINRAIDVFSSVYVNQNLGAKIQLNNTYSDSENLLGNSPENINFYQEKCKKIAYGFIVLNTMLFNPSIDKKPTFEEYLGLAEYDESYFVDNENDFFSFDSDTLKEFYENIKENEMKIPFTWSDSFDKYLLFKKCLIDLEGCFPFRKASFESNYICSSCVAICYRHLFSNSVSSLMNLPPSVFSQICIFLNLKDSFREYILYNKKDHSKTIENCKIFLENFVADELLVSTLVEVLEKFEKPKNSVLDFKSLFSRSISTNDSKNIGNFGNLSQGNEIFNLKFVDKDVCMKNLRIFQNICLNKKSFIKHILSRIIVSNFDLIDNFFEFDLSIQLEVLNQNPKNINLVSDQAKLKFLVLEFSNGNFNSFYYEIYSKITLINQDSFDAFCFLQQKFDDFNKFFIIKVVCGNEEKLIDFSNNELIHHQVGNSCELVNTQLSEHALDQNKESNIYSNKDNVGSFNIHKNIKSTENSHFMFIEVFSDYLSIFENLNKFFNLSNSILNIKFAKKIHKDSCPLQNKKFQEFDKIIYLILKSNEFDKFFLDYATCIINYMSDSLILLIELYEFIYPIFSQISKEFKANLIKILVMRIQLFNENGVSCCKISESLFSPHKLRKLIQRLLKDKIIDMNDLKPIQNLLKIRSESFEL